MCSCSLLLSLFYSPARSMSINSTFHLKQTSIRRGNSRALCLGHTAQSGISLTLHWGEGPSGLWFKCHELSLPLLRFSRLFKINVASLVICCWDSFFLEKYLFIWLCSVLVAAREIFSCGVWDLIP